MQVWEYKCLGQHWSKTLSEKELNKLGSEGWELLSIFTTGEYFNYIFKRVKQLRIDPPMYE